MGALAVAAGLLPASALAVNRTFDVATLAPPPLGSPLEAADPALSRAGTVVAFDAPIDFPYALPAYPLAIVGTREVYAVDVLTGSRTLISAAPDGVPADGSSTDPSVSADGATIAFASTATDLVPGTDRNLSNVYVRLASGQIELVSRSLHGGGGDRSSSQPAISADGRYVAFASRARDLIPRDHSRHADVFVRDLVTGRTALVSATRRGAPGDRSSSDPAISATGRFVSFDSAATDLPGSPRSRVAEVYVRDLQRRSTAIVSVTSGGVAQNRSVPAPFRQISSISADGRLVAFDSDATNLVRFDENRRSDVFLRDRARRRTTLISVDDAGYEGNNDSFAPSISADGTKVAFESFASNLARGGGPRENVFVRDLTVGATSVIDVLPDGGAPSRERVSELLQRPVLSADATVAAFESTAATLTQVASNEPHVLLRVMAPPVAVFIQPPPPSTRAHSVSAVVATSDAGARLLLCRVDRRPPTACRVGRITFAGLSRGRHLLSIRAGGPGLLYEPAPLEARVSVR